MSADDDPGQTTQFEVSRTGLKISSKRMSEFLAAFAVAAIAALAPIVYGLMRSVDANTYAITTLSTEHRNALQSLEIAHRTLACVVTAENKQTAMENCKLISGAK